MSGSFKHRIITIFLHLMGAHETIWLREQNHQLWYSLRRLERENDHMEAVLHRRRIKIAELTCRSSDVLMKIRAELQATKVERNSLRELLWKNHACTDGAHQVDTCQLCQEVKRLKEEKRITTVKIYAHG